MDQQKISMQIMNANRVILENTFAFGQEEKFAAAPWLTAKKKITNRYGKIYKRFYEDYEVSADYIMALYKIAGQE